MELLSREWRLCDGVSCDGVSWNPLCTGGGVGGLQHQIPGKVMQKV